jgi:caspase domain-containing protein
MIIRARSLFACLCLLVAVLSADTAAAADRRVALVIGNSAYSNAPALANTVADAVGLARLFRSAGFETVILRNDLGVMDFRRTVRDFLLTAEGADIAVVYYAGHGVEIGGMNYLVPVDAKLSRDYDVDDEAVSLDRIVWSLQSVKRLRLILLDACRDSPFPNRMRSAGGGVRAIESRGLLKPIDVGADTLVAYAAKAGSKSYDGNGPNSPYATALLRHLAEPAVDIRIALGRVRDDVLAMTGGRQEPFIYGSLGGATIALVPLPLPAAEKIEPLPAPLPPAVANAKAMLPASPERSPQPAEAVDPSLACIRDKQRLAQLRAEPDTGQIMRLEKELACESLRQQVQRLRESAGGEPAVPPAARNSARQQQVDAGPPPAEACARDTLRLQRLRAEPNPEEIRKLERDLLLRADPAASAAALR